jgi:gas vesicle protein
MNSDDWKNLFKGVAPVIGTALGGPLGGAAAAFLADKLGIESKTVGAVTEVLNSGKLTPDQILQVKLAEQDFNKFLEQNKIDLVKINIDNTKDARAMQVAVRSNVPAVLAFFVTLGFFGILGFMLGSPAYRPTEPLLIMLGSLGTAWTGIIGFYFGSSHGSQNKDVMLANSTPKPE